MFRENSRTRPSPPAVQNMLPLLEKSTLETSLLRSWMEQKAYYNHQTFSRLFLSKSLASFALLPPARMRLPSILLNWPQ